VTASSDGPIALAYQQLARLLASSSTFQTMISAANADDALDLIAWPEWNLSDDERSGLDHYNAPVPGATISQLPGMMLSIHEDGTVNAQLTVELRDKPRADYDKYSDQWKYFASTVGTIVVEMGQNSSDPIGNGSVYVELQAETEQLHPPILTLEDEETDENGDPFFAVMFQFTIGV